MNGKGGRIMVWQEYESVEKSALWFLGQSGFYLKSGGVSVVIDPYLSDCVGENSPLFTRIYPAPVSPYEMCIRDRAFLLQLLQPEKILYGTVLPVSYTHLIV